MAVKNSPKDNNPVDLSKKDGYYTIRSMKRILADTCGSIFNKKLRPEGGITGVACLGAPGLGKSQMIAQISKEWSDRIGSKEVVYEVGIFEKMKTEIRKNLAETRVGEFKEWTRENDTFRTRIRKTLGELSDSDIQDWRKNNGEMLTGFGKPVSALNDGQFDQFVATNETMSVPYRKTVAELSMDELEIFKKSEGRTIKTDYFVSLDSLDIETRRKWLIDNNYSIRASLSLQEKQGHELAGLATIHVTENGERVQRYAVPDVFRVISEFPNVILHMDEISKIRGQDALLSLLTEGYYQETKMPERCLVICTGNMGKEDFTTMAQEFGNAFWSRMAIFPLKANVKEWNEDFALPADVHPAIRAFATFHSTYFEDVQRELMQAQKAAKEPVSGPNLRSLVEMSFALYETESIFFPDNERDMSKLSDASRERFLEGFRALFSAKMRSDIIANEFVDFYEVVMTSVLPEVRRALCGQPLSDDFMNKMKGKGEVSKKLDFSSEALEMAFVDWLPRQTLSSIVRGVSDKSPEGEIKRRSMINNMLSALTNCNHDKMSLGISTFKMYVELEVSRNPSIKNELLTSLSDLVALSDRKGHEGLMKVIGDNARQDDAFSAR